MYQHNLEFDGANAAMDVLPNILAGLEFPEFSTHEFYGYFGFYGGVTTTMTSVEHAFQNGGLPGVEKFLTEQYR